VVSAPEYSIADDIGFVRGQTFSLQVMVPKMLITESMPINITHARTGATQSPTLLGTFLDPVLRV
jgi:hypothetical protein